MEGILNEGGIVILNPFRVGYAKFAENREDDERGRPRGGRQEGGARSFPQVRENTALFWNNSIHNNVLLESEV